MQCETVKGGLHGHKLIMQVGKQMMSQGIIKTSYRGLTMGLVGMFPYAALDLGTFEFIKKAYTKRNAKKYGLNEVDAAPGAIATAAIGGFSGAFGASAVYPLNLLRTPPQTLAHQHTQKGRDVEEGKDPDRVRESTVLLLPAHQKKRKVLFTLGIMYVQTAKRSLKSAVALSGDQRVSWSTRR